MYELVELRQQIAKLEVLETERKRAEEEIRRRDKELNTGFADHTDEG